MPKKKSRTNPFYVLLVIFGVAFSLTACAYGVMAFRAVHGADVAGFEKRSAIDGRWTGTSDPASDRPASNLPAADTPAGKSLLTFLDDHGAQLLGIELALLAVATFGAIGTDGYWNRAALGGRNVELDEPKAGQSEKG
jgi:hypothetical protein